jgi:hypothetical protein
MVVLGSGGLTAGSMRLTERRLLGEHGKCVRYCVDRCKMVVFRKKQRAAICGRRVWTIWS